MTPNHTIIQSPRPFSPIRLGVAFLLLSLRKITGRPKRKNWLPIEKRPFFGNNRPFFGNNMPFFGNNMPFSIEKRPLAIRETASRYQRNGFSLSEKRLLAIRETAFL